MLLVLVSVLWVGARALLWERPSFIERAAPHHSAPVRRPASAIPLEQVPLLGAPALPAAHRPALLAAPGDQPESWAAQATSASEPSLIAALDQSGADDASAPAVANTAAAHQLLWMAAMANLPLPAGLAFAHRGGEVANAGDDSMMVVRGRRTKPSFGLANRVRQAVAERRWSLGDAARWSGDGWMLARRGGDSPAVVAGGTYGPSYGANQIGAVLRYRLVMDNAHKPTLYVRGYGAMNGTGEREAALGLSARPIAGVPLVAMAEVRASHFMDGTTHVRPAGTVVTELPPLALGHGFEAETYVQGGYVGGAAATPFIDGQLRVEQVVTRLGNANLRLGVGAWGGAQENVERLDIGPSLRMAWSKGRVGGRLAVDWRVRVGGNALPTSGPALTLSAGF